MTRAPIRVLIADDEPPARRGLRALLESHADVVVVGEAASGREAIERIGALEPAVVFLDVRMPDGDGFAVLDALDAATRPIVIFTTAYDAYAVRAFDEAAVDYLLKPYDRARFDEALDRARRLVRARPAGGFADRITVRQGATSSFVPVANIECLEAEGNYVRLWVGDRSVLVRETLSAIGERLDPRRFARVHRSRIVQVSRVVQTESQLSGEFTLVLASGRRVMSGRTYREAVRDALRI